mmetsp:Transcript_8187/g.14508  ORF Transcript_8187/g.14508 Transcript_8187/m.14508 type:complete len:208 (+) Transcript_8187:1203-1826(+)
MVVFAAVKTYLFKLFYHFFSGSKSIESLKLRATIAIQSCVIIYDRDGLQIVPLAACKISLVVRWCDFHRARTDLHVDQYFIENNRNPTPRNKRMSYEAAMQMSKSWIIWVNSDSGISEHGFDPRSAHNDLFSGLAALNRVCEIVQNTKFHWLFMTWKLQLYRLCNFIVLHFEVRNYCAQVWAPRDQPNVTINEPFPIQLDKRVCGSL